MKTRKIISLLIAIALVVGLLAGCAPSGKENDPKPSTGDETNGDTPSNVEPEAPTKLVMWQQSWADSQDSPGNLRVKEAIDKELNIDLNVVVAPPDGAADRLAIMLSSDQQLDIVCGVVPDIISAYHDGAAARLNELLDEYGADIMEREKPEIWSFVTADDGSIAAVPNPVGGGDQNYLAVRKDLLAKYQMEKPTTLDQFEQYLARMKEDGLQMYISIFDFKEPAGDSKRVFRALGGMFMENGCTNMVEKDGKLVDYIRGDGFQDMVAKLNEWVDAGYIPKDISAWTKGKVENAFSAGTIGAYIDWGSVATIFPECQAAYIDDGHPDAYFDYCSPMTGGTAGGYAGTYSVGYGGPIWITQNSKVKETAMQYLNWLFADVEHYMLTVFGVKGYDWDWTDEATNTFSLLELPEGAAPYAGSYYYFDYYGNHIKNESATTTTKIYYNLADFIPTHEKYVPKNNLYATSFGVFSEIDKKYNASDFETFKSEELVKFIVGQRDMSEWDAFINEYLAMGGAEYDDERSEYWNTIKSKYGA